MNLNKLLCKTFDEEKKGYVTVADITSRIIEYGILSFIIILVIIVLYSGIVFTINIEQRLSYDNQDIDIIGFFGFIVLIIITVTVSWYLWDTKISRIKIAKCPLKENENK